MEFYYIKWDEVEVSIPTRIKKFDVELSVLDSDAGRFLPMLFLRDWKP